MTILAGFVKDGVVHMASDSQIGCSGSRRQMNTPKLHEITIPIRSEPTRLLYGLAGYLTDLCMLHAKLKPALASTFKVVDFSNQDDVYLWMVDVFAPTIKKLLKSHDSLKDEAACLTARSELMVGLAGKLYSVDCSFGVLAYGEGEYFAQGSGWQYGLGSLYATERMKDPRKRVEAAVKAAIKYDPHCGGEIQYMRT